MFQGGNVGQRERLLDQLLILNVSKPFRANSISPSTKFRPFLHIRDLTLLLQFSEFQLGILWHLFAAHRLAPLVPLLSSLSRLTYAFQPLLEGTDPVEMKRGVLASARY